MQILGHLALGYFCALLVNRYTKEKYLFPITWICALLPDLDVLARPFIIHRGPTHSIILAAAIFIPIYLVSRRWLPYFAALASHALIGDYFNPPEKLLWPLSNNWYGAPAKLSLTGTTLQTAELILFFLMVATMTLLYLKTRSPKQAPKQSQNNNTTQPT